MVSDVFVSYSHEDQDRVRPLVEALRITGLKVWWAEGLAGGERWRSRIDQELKSASCAIVVWSERSITADFVLDEASRAWKHQTLVSVRVDEICVPLGFGERQAIDLLDWTGKLDEPSFLRLVEAVRRLVEPSERTSVQDIKGASGPVPSKPTSPVKRASPLRVGVISAVVAGLFTLAAAFLNAYFSPVVVAPTELSSSESGERSPTQIDRKAAPDPGARELRDQVPGLNPEVDPTAASMNKELEQLRERYTELSIHARPLVEGIKSTSQRLEERGLRLDSELEAGLKLLQADLSSAETEIGLEQPDAERVRNLLAQAEKQLTKLQSLYQ